MCGITGFYSFTTATASTLAKVQQSNQKLIQRGPDDGHIFCTGQVALGHRRLSIIDTSEHAAQPMKDESGRYVIVFNGEIFNFKELSDVYLKNYRKDTVPTSDTEVLLALLIIFGTDCLPWLHGFFAFSFFDTHTGRMILARDPLGKKPLLYYQTADGFAFSSEMKSLLEWDVPRKINFSVLHQYLQLNYIPQPQSMLEGVLKLKAGHYMVIGTNGQESYEAFYTLSCRPEQYRQYTYEAAQTELVRKMDASIQERMIADVPLGAFLSGGIDSSVIVALASKYTAKLSTFSVGYKDNAFFDETNYAALVAKRYQTDHHVFSLSNDDFLEHLYSVLDYIDEPFADSSALPVYILSHYTRRHVTVALSGDGADEVFSGYNKHAAEWRMRQGSLARSLVKAAGPLWKALPHSRNNKLTNLFRQLDRFAAGARLDTKERYWRWAGFNTVDEASRLLHEKSRDKVNFSLMAAEKEALLSAIGTDDFNEVLLTDVNLVLLSDMLVKVDLMSMANSIEVRSPFLDKRVVDFAFGLPSSYKVDGGMKKKIVQDAFRDMLPAELYDRPKHGFEIPLLEWFRKELWGLINDDLLQKDFVQQQGIFDVHAIENLKLKLRSNNPEDSHATVWALIVFQYWWKKYIGGAEAYA
ncbi:MAG: asparagine synthase (glutamine-hydrolyzing) [Chitinophagaceae bacterium]|nr:asparagine synthase (glutamine-hydrolyzing) [Chitinophagaceae bacterium]